MHWLNCLLNDILATIFENQKVHFNGCFKIRKSEEKTQLLEILQRLWIIGKLTV